MWARDITETRDGTDDYPSDTTTTGVVTVGGSVEGEIERFGDRDWFAVDLVEGRLYRVDLEGRWTGAGTLRDPYLRGVYDANGVLLDGTRDDHGGVVLNSRAFFIAPEGATYYVDAGAQGYAPEGTGTYTLSVTEVQDEIAAGTGTSGKVDVGGSATGEIETAGDRDWFAVDLEAGKTYQFMLSGKSYSLDGTLHDAYLRGIHDAEGTLIDGTTDSDSGRWRNALVFYTADRTGIHYVAAGAADDGKGTYTLSVTDIGTDDYAADTSTTGRVVVGESTTGTHYPGDRDWIAVDLEAGKHYEFEQKGALTGDGTLGYTLISWIYDADGNIDHGFGLRKHSPGTNARMIFTAREDATY